MPAPYAKHRDSQPEKSDNPKTPRHEQARTSQLPVKRLQESSQLNLMLMSRKLIVKIKHSVMGSAEIRKHKSMSQKPKQKRVQHHLFRRDIFSLQKPNRESIPFFPASANLLIPLHSFCFLFLEQESLLQMIYSHQFKVGFPNNTIFPYEKIYLRLRVHDLSKVRL